MRNARLVVGTGAGGAWCAHASPVVHSATTLPTAMTFIERKRMRHRRVQVDKVPPHRRAHMQQTSRSRRGGRIVGVAELASGVALSVDRFLEKRDDARFVGGSQF